MNSENGARPSFIKNYIEYASEVTDAPSVFHLYLAYVAVASVCGNNIYLRLGDQKIYPNLFMVLIAPSSLYRKSTSLMIAKRLVQDINNQVVLPNEFSQESLAETLAASPEGTLFYSEFASFLGASQKDYMRGIKEFLTDIYDCPPYYLRKLKSGPVEIKNPVLSIVGATTATWFLDRIKRDDLEGGFLVRFLWVPAFYKEKTFALPPIADKAKREALVDELKEIERVGGEMSLSEDARRIYVEWHKRHESEAENLGEHLLCGFYSRFETYALKFAMITEVAATRERTISGRSMKVAIDKIELLKKELKKLSEEQFAFGWFQRAKLKIFKKIKEKKQIPREDLLRFSHLNKRDFDLVINTLIDEGRVREERTQTAGRPKVVYKNLGS